MVPIKSHISQLFNEDVRASIRETFRPLHVSYTLQMDILLSHILGRIRSADIEIVDPEAVVVEKSGSASEDVNGERVIRGIGILRLMAMANENMVNVVLADQVEVPATNTVRERPVRVCFVLGELKRKMVMGDDDLFVSAGRSFELVLKPSPFCGGVFLEFRKIADQRDGIQKDETVSLVAEGAVVTDVIVHGELLQCLDAADVVVPGE